MEVLDKVSKALEKRYIEEDDESKDYSLTEKPTQYLH